MVTANFWETTMFKFNQVLALSVTLVLILANAVVTAQEEPKYYSGAWPNSAGDYPIRRQYQGTWRVVDPDPQGLNCRNNIPPYAGSEKIVARFLKGTEITLIQRGRGAFEIGEDKEGLPWLAVRLGNNICWVRANQQYVVPVKQD